MVPIVILMIWIGVYPRPYLRSMETSVSYWLNHVQQASALHNPAAQAVLPPVAQRQATPVADVSGKEE
jgi:hypothetical protein